MDVVINPKIDVYRRFIEGLRHKDLKVGYLVIRNCYPKLKAYVRALRDVEFSEAKAHTMFGHIKTIVNSYIEYFNTTMNDVIKLTRDYKQAFTKEDLSELAQLSIDKQTVQQIEFANEYLPVKSQAEQEIYDKILARYDATMESLMSMATDISRLDKQFKVEKFLEEQFAISLKRQNKLLSYTHKFMALMLAGRLQEIDVGVEEILLRVCNNLKDIRFQCEGAVNNLLNLLYNKNKEWIYLQRKSREMTVDTYEVERTIEAIRWKIKNQDPTVCDLDKEVEYWTKISAQIDKIANTLSTLMSESKNIEAQYTYIQSGQSELTDDKKKEAALKKIEARRKVLYVHTVNIAKALFSLYQTRGNNEVIFKDKNGVYHVDEYGHQVYHFNNFYKSAHVDCRGNLRIAGETEKYFFNDHGRFVYDENGEEIYKIASCASMYKLDETTNYFKKITKDCGHSEHSDKYCRMNLRTLYDEVLLPDVQPVHYAKTLDKATVAYLHDAFAHILPAVLAEVSKLQPKNPIHFIAHQLLRHKYRLTSHLLALKKKRAENYLAMMQQGLKDNKEKEVDLWRRKNLIDKHLDDDEEQLTHLMVSQADEMLLEMLTNYGMNY